MPWLTDGQHGPMPWQTGGPVLWLKPGRDGPMLVAHNTLPPPRPAVTRSPRPTEPRRGDRENTVRRSARRATAWPPGPAAGSVPDVTSGDNIEERDREAPSRPA